MRYRTVIDEKPKYLSDVGYSPRPFNVQALYYDTDDTIYVTEGEFDAIILDQANFAAIGIPGSQAWKRVFARLLRYRSVVVLADGDDAGKAFSQAIANDVRARVIRMPKGEDVNSMFLGLDEDEFRKLITE